MNAGLHLGRMGGGGEGEGGRDPSKFHNNNTRFAFPPLNVALKYYRWHVEKIGSLGMRLDIFHRHCMCKATLQ